MQHSFYQYVSYLHRMLMKSVSGTLKRTCFSVTPLEASNDMGCAFRVLSKGAPLVYQFVSVM